MTRRGVFLFMALGATNAATYSVRPDGSGDYTTIQACANAALAGDTCLVSAGAYNEHVTTAHAGTGESARVTFQAQGLVTMQGFQVQHPYVTVDGFDITGYTNAFTGQITIMFAGDYCQLLNNVLRDGATNVQAIDFYESSGRAANHCVVRGNRLSNMAGNPFLNVFGSDHLFESNYFEYQNGFDYIRLFGSGSTFRRNVFWRGTAALTGNHPDFLQNFGGTDVTRSSENMLFEENWISDLISQFCQTNSSVDGVGALVANVRNIVFRRNLIANIEDNANIGMPGVTFDHNTFYRLAYSATGNNVGFSGSLTRGDPSGGTLKSNLFLADGSSPATVNGTSGWYAMSGAVFNLEPIALLITSESTQTPSSTFAPIALAIFTDLQSNGYVNSNGVIFAPASALASISDFTFTVASGYQTYKQAVYDRLVETVVLNANSRSTFLVDYNYVGGSVAAGYPSKRISGCLPGETWRDQNFCESHGVNGGDPLLVDVTSILGADGIPFTVDDGLKPLPGSPLCGAGEGGSDIGAYSCDPAKVFANVTASGFTGSLRGTAK